MQNSHRWHDYSYNYQHGHANNTPTPVGPTVGHAAVGGYDKTPVFVISDGRLPTQNGGIQTNGSHQGVNNPAFNNATEAGRHGGARSRVEPQTSGQSTVVGAENSGKQTRCVSLTTLAIIISVVVIVTCVAGIAVVVVLNLNNAKNTNGSSSGRLDPTATGQPGTQTSSEPLPGSCGIQKKNSVHELNPKIVGGQDAEEGEWPWQIALLQTNGGFDNFICGGSLISEEWVVTAGHCIPDPSASPSQFAVYINAYNWDDRTWTRHEIDDIIVHEGFYYPYTNVPDNDIALLKLSTKADLSLENVNTVCLPSDDTVFSDGDQCYITGWGSLEMGVNNYPRTLQEAPVPFLETNTCNTATGYRNRGWISPNMVCAGYDQGGIDSCQGDSGGPLVCRQNGQWILAGITSWGNGCAVTSYPGVYTKVSEFTSWIGIKTNLNFTGLPAPLTT